MREFIEGHCSLKKCRKKTILEISAGLLGEMSGDRMLVWARHSTASRIIAVDIDRKNIERLMKNGL
jgi:hypothetical protein